MTECIIITSWILVVVGVVLIIAGGFKLDIDHTDHRASWATVVAAFAFVVGISITVYGVVPYLHYLPCIAVIP